MSTKYEVASADYKVNWLHSPKVIAIAQDRYLNPQYPFPDSENLFGVPPPKYGQDILNGAIARGNGRSAPGKQDVGSSPETLKPKMKELLGIFAAADPSGMAKRLFDEFLKKQPRVRYFDDDALNRIASRHPNVEYFCGAAFSAPDSMQSSIGKTRIHQALKRANWDINRVGVLRDLGVPAFNRGYAPFRTGDFGNGLGVMINGVQHVYVVAKFFNYDKAAGRYLISVRYLFYDVFGLDDDDLREYGAQSDSLSTAAGRGITAWWQLQHQHGYAPLVTRIAIDRTYDVPAV